MWQKLSRGGKAGCLSGIAASIVGAASMGLAFGVMIGATLSEKIGLGGLGLVGFFLVAGIIIAPGACLGAGIGHAIYRFDTWRTLRPGGKLGGALGVILATPVTMSLGSAPGGAIGISLGESLAGNLGAGIGCLLGFVLVMDTILVAGFGVGAAIGHLIHLFFGSSPSKSVA